MIVIWSVVRSSYLHNGISYTGKMTSLYWIRAQCLCCVAKFCWHILAIHPTFLPLLIENSPQPTILEYAPVIALANYAAWCHQRMTENTKWFRNTHSIDRQSARQISHKVAANWVISISFSPEAVHPCAKVMALFRHGYQWVNIGCMKI